MVFVEVDDESCCYAFGAQRVVVLEPFVVGHAIIELAMDDEGWRLAVFRERARRLRLVFFQVFPRPDASPGA